MPGYHFIPPSSPSVNQNALSTLQSFTGEFVKYVWSILTGGPTFALLLWLLFISFAAMIALYVWWLMTHGITKIQKEDLQSLSSFDSIHEKEYASTHSYDGSKL